MGLGEFSVKLERVVAQRCSSGTRVLLQLPDSNVFFWNLPPMLKALGFLLLSHGLSEGVPQVALGENLRSTCVK